MPLFAMIGRDGPRGLELRKRHRDAHLAGLAPLDAAGRIRHAGPLRDASGEPCGSLVVFEADDLEAARAQAAADPYVVEGVFASHEVFETVVVFPKGG
ncbi:MAG TPA: YciI family protein [Myxococcota bacterium]|nr:YciI family protein [Myxococcota bacterium]